MQYKKRLIYYNRQLSASDSLKVGPCRDSPVVSLLAGTASGQYSIYNMLAVLPWIWHVHRTSFTNVIKQFF